MVKLNYIELINKFWIADLEKPFMPSDTRLYFYLLHTCNKLAWRVPFGQSDRYLSMSLMLSVPTIREAKNRLKQRGLIDFKAPDKASKSLDGQTKYLFPTVKKNCTDTCTDTLTDTCTDTCTDTLTDTCTNNKLNKTKLNKTILNPHNPLSENLKIFENPELPKLPEKDWREDYEVYREQLRKAFVEIVTPEYIAEHQEYYSQNLDIYKTIEKACVDFWSLPAGWQHKKKSKTKVIDWKATFNNMLSSKFNHVYKPWTN